MIMKKKCHIWRLFFGTFVVPCYFYETKSLRIHGVLFFAFHGTHAGGRGWKWVKIKIIQFFLRCLKIPDANLGWILMERVKNSEKSQNSRKFSMSWENISRRKSVNYLFLKFMITLHLYIKNNTYFILTLKFI